MTTEPTHEPTLSLEEEQEEYDDDEGEESDVYEIKDDDEGDSYESDEDEDEEVVDETELKNMTALLLGGQNGTPTVGHEEEEEGEEEDDEEYDEEDEGTAENPIDLSSVVGSKRGVDELADGDAYGDEDEEGEGETVAKKARV